MSTLCKDITEYIESFAPLEFAEDWDNIGLLLGSRSSEIEKVLVCLDVTDKTVSEAIDQSADMIISHHPVIFKSLKRITSDDVKGSLLNRLIKGNISVYSAHTNLDVSEEGINALLAEMFKLTEVENLKNHETSKMALKYVSNNIVDRLPGLGKIGVLSESVSLKDLVGLAKQYLNTPTIRASGDLTKRVKKVAVFCGSFDDDLGSLIAQGIDVLITGEIKYHTVLDALEAELSVIEAGHFITERIIVDKLCSMLSAKFPDVRFIASNEKDPYSYI